MSYAQSYLSLKRPFRPNNNALAQFKNDPKITHQLIYAVFTGDLEAVEKLLKKGARPNQEMMYFSIGAQQYKITALLLQHKPPQDSRYFHFAYQNMDDKMCQLLLENKMKPDLSSKEIRSFVGAD